MEPTRTKVSIGEFPVLDVKLNAVRIALGQGVNVWIHMNFEHGAQPGDTITLLAEIPNAIFRSTPEQRTS